MGVPSLVFLTDGSIWQCQKCGTHLAYSDDLISNDFRGSHGPAKLFDTVANTRKYDRRRSSMTTGDFVVENIKCIHCNSYLGWTYIKSYKRSEAYKVGKFILEVALIIETTAN